MLIYKQVVIDGFRSLGEVSVSLEKQGILGLQGRNLCSGGSNGSGKTSILEAVSWCIFGKTFCPEDSVHDVCNEVYTPSQAFVKLTVDKDGDEYELFRYRNHKTFGTGAAVRKNGKRVTLDKDMDARFSFGVPILNLMMSVFAASTVFSASTPRFGTGMTDSGRKSVLLATMGLHIDYSHRAKTAHDDIVSEISAEERRLEELIRSTEQSKKHYLEMKESQGKIIEEREGKIRQEQDEIRQAAEGARDLQDAEDDLKLAQSEESDLLSKIRVREEEITTDLIKEKETLSKIESERKDLVKDYRRYKDLAEQSKCSVCEQEIDGSKYPIKELERKITKCVDDGIEVKERITSISNRLTEFNNAGSRRLRDIKEQRESLEHRVADCKICLSRVREGKRRLQFLLDQKDSLTDLQPMMDQIRFDVERRAGIETRLADKYRHKEMLAYWKKGFGKNGLPAEALRQMIPSVNQRLQKYLDILSSGLTAATLSLKSSKLVIDASTKGGGSSYSKMSEGERRRIDLALYLACHDATALRTGGSNMLFIDEGVDVIDGIGIDSYIRALQYKVDTTPVDTIVVVSHREELMTLLQKRIVVTKNKTGISTVEMEEGDISLEMMAG